jgi:iron complex outermembrane receptor protein
MLARIRLPVRRATLRPLSRTVAVLCAAVLGVCAAHAWEGRVVLGNGEPVAGARVTPVGETGGATTGPEGRFELPDPAPPTVLVELPDGKILLVEVPPRTERGRDLVVRPGLAESVITTAPMAGDLHAPPGSSPTTVPRREAVENADNSLQETLARLPGAPPRSPDPDRVIAFRGLSDRRTAFLLDRATLTTQRRAGVSGGALHPGTWSGVEVVRGPDALIYGSGAMGGVILVKSPWAGLDERHAVQVDLEGRGGAVEGGSGALRFQHRGWSVAGGYRVAGDPEAADGRALEGEYDQRSGFVGRRWMAGDSLIRLGVRADRLSDADRPRAADDDRLTRVPADEQIRMVLAVDTPGKIDRSLVAWWGRSRREIVQVRPPSSTRPGSTAGSDSVQSEAGARWIARGAAPVARWLVGAEGRVQYEVESDVETRFLPLGSETPVSTASTPLANGQSQRAAAFARLERSVDPRTTIAAGARLEPTRFRADGPEGRRSTSAFGWAASTSLVRRTEGWGRFTLQASRTFRQPTITDRYFTGVTGRGYLRASPELDPESGLHFDAAWRWESSRTHLSAAVYRYRIEDVIERRFLGESDVPGLPGDLELSVYQFVNGGDGLIEGGEISAGLRLAPRLDVQLALHRVLGSERESGRPLSGIPADGATFRVRKGFRDGSYLRAEVIAADDDPRAGPGERPLPGYAFVDLGAGWRVTPGLELRLTVRNALDKSYPLYADDDAPQAPGRTFVLGLGLDL